MVGHIPNCAIIIKDFMSWMIKFTCKCNRDFWILYLNPSEFQQHAHKKRAPNKTEKKPRKKGTPRESECLIKIG